MAPVVVVRKTGTGSFKMRCALNMLIAAIITVPIDSFAQLQELLTPVTGPELAEVTAKNDYFLKKYLYNVKHHRIVIADIDVLLSKEPFVIPLFDGNSLTVEPSPNQPYPIGSTIIWTGSISNPYISVNQLRIRMRTGEKNAEMVHNAMFGVDIGASLYEYDIESGVNFPTRARQTDSNNSWFYGMVANITASGAPGTYSLRPLDMGGPYHILVEIDPSKIVTPGPLHDPDNPEMAQKRRDWEEFRKSLGEDPRIAIIRGKRTQ